tara:strand:+ start:106 stop:393 length:288 start_codon:yes stop_codon:yes gene_type:complete
MKVKFLLFIALFLGCGEDVEIYETTCPNMVNGEWMGEVYLHKKAQGIAYWSCVEGHCTYHDSYYVKAWLETSEKVKVCCGMEDDRVDMVKLVITD